MDSEIVDGSGHQLGTVPFIPTDAYAIPNGTLKLKTPTGWASGKGTFNVVARLSTYSNGKLTRQYSKSLHFDFADWVKTAAHVAVAAVVVPSPLLALIFLRALIRRRRRTAALRQELASRLREIPALSPELQQIASEVLLTDKKRRGFRQLHGQKTDLKKPAT